MLSEVRERDDKVKTLQRTQKKKQKAKANNLPIDAAAVAIQSEPNRIEPVNETVSKTEESIPERIIESEKRKKPVPFVRVYAYEELKRESSLL
ncbi:MAG: hypothetical protein HC852_15400 [Acaryochloridaceae cyanobacterium RU_4_10]|nr:hypothetical protein [Acaryochloridaceae cyanobacterium RU_4_10]